MSSPSRRLNITNGDSAAGTLSEAGIEGKIIPWRDVLHEGPVDSSLSLEELSKQRARFIAGWGKYELARISKDFAERDRVVQRLDYFDEIVLWFEDDLYDQLQLIQLLDFFAGGAAASKKVSIIVVDGYIPPLSGAELKALDRKRPAVTAQQLALGQRAWRAFGSADPTGITRLLDEDTSALPYLARALTRELEEFPSTDNGLSRSEREAMSVIAEGHNTPVRAFLEVAKKQESIYLGDSVFYSYLERLSGTTNPLLTWKDGRPIVAPDQRTARTFVEGEMILTPLGREVLAGGRDWQGITTHTRWLGGVEIAPGDTGWRWDPTERELVRKDGVAQMGFSKTNVKPRRKTSANARKKPSGARKKPSVKARRKTGKTRKKKK